MANTCEPSWLDDYASTNYRCYHTPGEGFLNDYQIVSQHFSDHTCSGPVLYEESKTTCWSDALGIHDSNLCWGDDTDTMVDNSQGALGYTCEEVAQNVEGDACNDQNVFPPEAPDGWFNRVCCKFCGHEVGNLLIDKR